MKYFRSQDDLSLLKPPSNQNNMFQRGIRSSMSSEILNRMSTQEQSELFNFSPQWLKRGSTTYDRHTPNQMLDFSK